MARAHLTTHPILGPATWRQMEAAAKALGKVCSWCHGPVSKKRRTRCGKRECDEHLWQAQAWGRCRQLALRANRFCRCGARAAEVDHIVPVCLGGTGDQTNLRPLCCECHRQATAKLRREKGAYIAA